MNFSSYFWQKKQKAHLLIGLSEKNLSHLLPIEAIELPKMGKKIKKGDILCVLESSKSAVELESPVSGKILKVHEELKKNISLLKSWTQKNSWICEIDPEND